MARYRKIDPRIWNDEKFNELSLRAKLIFLFILTHPSQTFLGAFRATREGLAIELGIPQEGFAEGFAEPFDELLSKGLIMYSQKVKTVYAPNFLKYNFPDNPNQVRGFDVALDFIPEGDLLRFVLWNSARIVHESQRDSFIKALPKPFADGFEEGLPEGFAEPFRKSLPKLRAKNQEPRIDKPPLVPPSTSQAEEQGAEADEAAASAPSEPATEKRVSSKRGTRLTAEAIPDEWTAWLEKEDPALDPKKVYEEFHDYWVGIPGQRGVKLDWFATFRNSCRRQRFGAHCNTNVN